MSFQHPQRAADQDRVLDARCLRRFSADETIDLDTSCRGGAVGADDDHDPRYHAAIAPLLLDPQHAWHVSSVVNVDLPGLRWSDPHSSGRWQRWLLRALPEMHSMARLDVRDGLMGDLWMRALVDALIAQRTDAAGTRRFREQQRSNQQRVRELAVARRQLRRRGGQDAGDGVSPVNGCGGDNNSTASGSSDAAASSLLLPTLVLHFENNLLSQASAQQIGRLISCLATSAASTAPPTSALGSGSGANGGGFNLELHLNGNSRMGDHSAQMLAAHAAKAFSVRDALSRVTLRFLDMSRCDVGGRGLGDLLVNCSLFCRAVFTDGVQQQQQQQHHQPSSAQHATAASASAVGGRAGSVPQQQQQQGRAGSVGSVASASSSTAMRGKAKSQHRHDTLTVVPTQQQLLQPFVSQSIFSRDAMRSLPTGAALRVVDLGDNVKMNSSALSMLVPALLVCCPHLRGLGMAQCAQQGAAVLRALCDALTSLCRSCQRVPALEFVDLSACRLSDASIFKFLEFLTREGDGLRLRIIDVSGGAVLPDDAPEKAPVVVKRQQRDENKAAHGDCKCFIRSSLGRDAWRALLLAVAGEDDGAVDKIASAVSRRGTARRQQQEGGADNDGDNVGDDDEGFDIVEYLKSVAQSPSRSARARSVGNTGSRAALDAAMRAATSPRKQQQPNGATAAGEKGGVEDAAVSPSRGDRPGAGGNSRRAMSSPASLNKHSLVASPINKTVDTTATGLQTSTVLGGGGGAGGGNDAVAASVAASPFPAISGAAASTAAADDINVNAAADRQLNFTPASRPSAAPASASDDGDRGDAGTAATSRSASAVSRATAPLGVDKDGRIDASDLSSQASSVLHAAKAAADRRAFSRSITVPHEADNAVLCALVHLVAGRVPTAAFFTRILLADLQDFCCAQQEAQAPGSSADPAHAIAITDVHVFLNGVFAVHATSSGKRFVMEQIVRAAFAAPPQAAFPRVLRVLHEVVARQRQLADIVAETAPAGAGGSDAARRSAVSIRTGEDLSSVVDCPKIERCERHRQAMPTLDLPPLPPPERDASASRAASASPNVDDAGTRESKSAALAQLADNTAADAELSIKSSSAGDADDAEAKAQQQQQEEQERQQKEQDEQREQERQRRETEEAVAAAARAAERAAAQLAERNAVVEASVVQHGAIAAEAEAELLTLRQQEQGARAALLEEKQKAAVEAEAAAAKKAAAEKAQQGGSTPSAAPAAAAASDDDDEFSLAPPPDSSPPGAAAIKASDAAPAVAAASTAKSAAAAAAPPAPPPAPSLDVFAFEALARSLRDKEAANKGKSPRSAASAASAAPPAALSLDPFRTPTAAGIPAQVEAAITTPALTTAAARKRIASAFEVVGRALKYGAVPLPEGERRKRRLAKGWTTETTTEGIDEDDPGAAPRLERVEVVLNIEFDDFLVVKTCHSAWSGASRVLSFMHPLLGNGFAVAAGAEVLPLIRPGDVSTSPTVVLCFVSPRGAPRTLVVRIDPDGFGDLWPGETAADDATCKKDKAACVLRVMKRLESVVEASCNSTKVWKSVSINS